MDNVLGILVFCFCCEWEFYFIYKEGFVLCIIYYLLFLYVRRKINIKFINKEW